MDTHDDFQGPEPFRGLPEVPPEGESVLWQGSPSWWALARDALMIRWVAAYFGALAVWRGWVAAETMGPEKGLEAVSVLVVMGAIACAILGVVAWVQARATVYTITNRRVAMRVGAALTVTLNLPYRWIASADAQVKRDGTGTIALDLMGDNKFSYLVLWPHVRPWHIQRCQPALRCVPQAQWISRLLAQHARAAVTRGAEADNEMPATKEMPGKNTIAAE